MSITLTEINKSEAIRFMGYGKSKPDEVTLRNINECEKALLEAIKPEYVYRIFNISHAENSVKILGTSLELTGKDICRHLKDCDKAALLAVTVSGGADRLIFLEVLNAGKRIGLSALENCMMVPTKSVTAVIGLSNNEISKGMRGCVCCNMRDRCAYRIRGEHCEL